MIDPTALKILAEIPLPNLSGNQDNLQYGIYEKTDYWNFSERVDWNITDSWKVFVRYGQFKANSTSRTRPTPSTSRCRAATATA